MLLIWARRPTRCTACPRTSYADNGTYAGLTLAALQAIDAGVKVNATKAGDQTATAYCIDATVGGKTWNMAGPAASIVP